MRTDVDTVTLPYACPRCGVPAWKFCWTPGCEDYVENLRARPTAHSEGVAGQEAAPQNASTARAVVDNRKEREIRVGIKEALRTLGFDVWDNEQERATRVDAGLADLFVAGHGITAWIEVKRPLTGKPSEDKKRSQTEAQERFEEVVTRCGGTYVLMRSEAEAIEWVTVKPWAGT